MNFVLYPKEGCFYGLFRNYSVTIVYLLHELNEFLEKEELLVFVSELLYSRHYKDLRCVTNI